MHAFSTRRYEDRVANLGPLEGAIMEVLWERLSGTAGELTQVLKRQRISPLSSKTTFTCLTRLEKKGLVRHAKESRQFRFFPAMTREQAVTKFVGDEMSLMIDHYGDLAVAVFVQRLGTIPGRLRYLRELLEGGHEGDNP